MKKKYLFSFVLVILFLCSAFPAWAVNTLPTVNVGSVAFSNMGAQPGWRDDFDGSAGPLGGSYLVHDNGIATLTGTGILSISSDTRVSLPLDQTSGRLSNAGFAVNFQNGLPNASFGYGMRIRSPNQQDGVNLEVVTLGNGQSYLFFGDESHQGSNGQFLNLIPLQGFTSIGLGLFVDNIGNVNAGYLLNLPDGFPQDPTGFIPLSGTTQLNQGSENYDVRFYAIGDGIPYELPSNVPIPTAVWLLGSGLIGLVGLRRKISK
ncbi:MAG: VPLPA-CTERM sorting domain-containing protein [Proteobacteria bacterium]|nr:VPLPA-CTERM sorting domain-containing protein [Pseudomonadota bacterium]